MILGIGIDSVEINRFERWKSYSHRQLERIFTPQEIAYCFAQPNNTTERLAARFAAREAFYKALSSAAPQFSTPFLTMCRKVAVIMDKAPGLAVDWEYFGLAGVALPEAKPYLSITHTRAIATALVILETNSSTTRTFI